MTAKNFLSYWNLAKLFLHMRGTTNVPIFIKYSGYEIPIINLDFKSHPVIN